MTKVDGVGAVVFDIVGTLLCSAEGNLREFRRALTGVVDDDAIVTIAHEVGDLVDRHMERISRGEEPFALETAVRRRYVPGVLTRHGAAIGDVELEQLVHAGERFDAYPGAPEQLGQLARHVAVIGLTNGALDQVTKASARTGLRWHSLIGTQVATTYKPSPAAYALVPELLHIDPATAVFVAAHPWDLRAAAAAGFRTAYLPRPHTDAPEPGDRFDLTIASLDELVSLLEGRRGAERPRHDGPSATP